MAPRQTYRGANMLLLSSCLQSSLVDDGTEAGSMWLAGVLFPMSTLGKGAAMEPPHAPRTPAMSQEAS